MTSNAGHGTEHAADRRRALADQLAASGDLRTAPWRRTLERVPREAFLGDRIYDRTDDACGTWWTPINRREVTVEHWLTLAYQNETWVTQIEGDDRDDDRAQQGSPTSSSTLPGLVVAMLEDADIADGHRVLEIGTGTGYSTALLCERLGDDHVTSIEVDRQIAARAAASLATVGYHPTLLHADGLAGHPDPDGYDRIIATCSVRTIPPAWLRQCRPGGRILVPVCGWLYGSGLARLDVDSSDHATGRFLPGTVSFMLARPHLPPPIIEYSDRTGDTRPTALDPHDVLTDWMMRFIAQLAAPGASGLGLLENDDLPATELLLDHPTGSYAWLTPSTDGWTVTQNGPVRLWDRIEESIQLWRDAGCPPQHAFSITVSSSGQTVALDDTARAIEWHLPDGA